MSRERHHGSALRPDTGDLAVAKRIAGRRTLERDGQHEAALHPRAPGQKLLDRHVPCAISALQRNRGVEREQGNAEIAERRRREQIAADGAHVAHGGPTDGGGDRMQKGQFALGENAREGDAGADGDTGARDVEAGEGMVRGAHDRRHRDIALVDRAHHQRAAAEIARVALRRQRRRRLARGRKRPYRDRHE